jgi:putative DNA primase/helicase
MSKTNFMSREEREALHSAAKESRKGPEVELRRASDITPEPFDWVWHEWMARGKIHLIAGQPGVGKTTLAMSFAATVSSGGRWPDGTRCAPGNVVVWSGEDDPTDTLTPRLALAGADLERVYFIGGVTQDGKTTPFDPAHDMDVLARKLGAVGGATLLIVDPVVAVVAGDSHKNAEVRRGLQGLVDLATEHRCAVLGITHLAKGSQGRDPLERLVGSVAFGGVARLVMLAAKHQEEGEDGRVERVLCRSKSNIGPDHGGFTYDLRQGELDAWPGVFSSAVLWGAAVQGEARDLIATADEVDTGEGGGINDAKRFLLDLLADGPVPTKALKADADGAGYSWATVRRALKAIGAEAEKTGMSGGWAWKLARSRSNRSEEFEDAHEKGTSMFEQLRAPSTDVVQF